MLLFEEKFLFTGDHLAWDRHGERLDAHRDYCWFSWERQTGSMARLARFGFEWVLPGHGQRVRLPQGEMRRQMQDLVRRMRDPSEPREEEHVDERPLTCDEQTCGWPAPPMTSTP